MKKLTTLLIFLILITGCGKKAEQPIKEEPGTTTPPVVEEKKLQILDPESNTRPIAVMINNHPAARPYHSGLQDAYLVYEIIVEGGFTRMMAVFKDQDTDRIGSVRSSRHYFLDYALENDAIYTHFGWSPQAQSDIPKLGVKNVNFIYDNGSFRDKTLPVAYEHTAFTTIENIIKTATAKKYSLTTNQPLLLDYSIDEIKIEDGKTANNVVIPYSSISEVEYKYDATTKTYLRYFNDVKHVDAVTKMQYTAKNIIVIQVANSTIDSYGRQTLANIGSGTGYFITNGVAKEIKWEKTSRSSQTKYTYLNGEEIKVNDGNTYIQIQPKGKTLTIN